MIASVFGRREKNTSTVGWRMRIEVPRSPCSALPMKIRNCWYSDPSSPSALIMVIRSSGVASFGQHQIDRIAGEPAEEEHDRRHHEQQHDALEQSLDDVALHGGWVAGAYFFQGFSSGRGMRSNTSPSSCRPGMAANCPTWRRLIA